MGRVFSLLMLASLALGGIGCEQQTHGQPRTVARVESLEGRIGKTCTIYLRHDAMGVRREAPLSTDTWGNASVQGTLLGADDNWMIVKRPNGLEAWVPRGNILMVEFNPTS